METRTDKSVRRPRGSTNVYADLGYKSTAKCPSVSAPCQT